MYYCASAAALLASASEHRSNTRVLLLITFVSSALLSSQQKTQSKNHAYHDPDYESRIQAALAGVNKRKHMSLVAAARVEDISVFVYFFIFHLPTNNYPGFLVILFLLTGQCKH